MVYLRLVKQKCEISVCTDQDTWVAGVRFVVPVVSSTTVARHCLVYSLYCITMYYLCRSFVAKELASLEDEEQARTPGVLRAACRRLLSMRHY